MSRPVTPTCLLTTQLTSVFSAQVNARPAAVLLSVPLVPTLRLFQSMESVTIAHILATHAHHPPQPAHHASQDSTSLEPPVSLPAQLVLTPRTESVFVRPEFSSATNALLSAQFNTETSEVSAKNVTITVPHVMELNHLAQNA